MHTNLLCNKTATDGSIWAGQLSTKYAEVSLFILGVLFHCNDCDQSQEFDFIHVCVHSVNSGGLDLGSDYEGDLRLSLVSRLSIRREAMALQLRNKALKC